jgi:hypothetical protein
MTGFSELTCRMALGELVKAGVLVPGPSRTARPRAAGFDRTWERADVTLTAGGELLELHDTYRQAVASAPAVGDTANSGPGGTVATVNGDATVGLVDPGGIVQAIRAARITPPRGQKVSAVVVVWTDGSVATLYPPGAVIATSALPVADELRTIPAKPGADGEPEPFP